MITIYSEEPLQCSREHIDTSTECVILFLNKCDTSPDAMKEADLDRLKALGNYYDERGREIINIHRFYAERLAQRKPS